jgi:hypothetical protein
MMAKRIMTLLNRNRSANHGRTSDSVRVTEASIITSFLISAKSSDFVSPAWSEALGQSNRKHTLVSHSPSPSQNVDHVKRKSIMLVTAIVTIGKQNSPSPFPPKTNHPSSVERELGKQTTGWCVRNLHERNKYSSVERAGFSARSDTWNMRREIFQSSGTNQSGAYLYFDDY